MLFPTKVAFIFTDAEVKEESFLEYINQMLMTGEVAGLFAKDELDQIVNDIRPIMRAESPSKSPLQMEHSINYEYITVINRVTVYYDTSVSLWIAAILVSPNCN